MTIKTWQERCSPLHGLDHQMAHMHSEIKELREALEAAEKDAARYRWYMQNILSGSIGFGDGWIGADETKEEWDALADAAIAAQVATP
ncbi:MAG: hypothetical protein HXX19_18245 [Rhodoferax sp.]|nr:hypothetical protein [Rhodoferax sp.]